MYERIKDLMVQRNIKYDRDLEDKAGLKQGTIRNIKNGHTPKHETIVKIATVLGVTANYLVTGETETVAFSQDPYDRKRELLKSIIDSLSHDQVDAFAPILIMASKAKDINQLEME